MMRKITECATATTETLTRTNPGSTHAQTAKHKTGQTAEIVESQDLINIFSLRDYNYHLKNDMPTVPLPIKQKSL